MIYARASEYFFSFSAKNGARLSPVHGRYMKWEVSKQKSGLTGLHLNSALTPRTPDKELEAAEYRMELNTAALNNGAKVLQFSDIYNHMIINQLWSTFGAPFCPYCAPSPCLSDIRSFEGFFLYLRGHRHCLAAIPPRKYSAEMLSI